MMRINRPYRIGAGVLSIILTACGSICVAQDSIKLPPPSGNHAIGRSSFQWEDSDRLEVMTPDPGDFRELVVTVWYPAEKQDSAGNLANAPYLNRKEAWKQNFGADTVNALSTVAVNSLLDANPINAKEIPLLVFSPGRGMGHWQYTILFEDLASHGWAVAAIDHTHMGLVALDETRLVGPHADWDAPPELFQRSPEEIDAFWNDMHPYLAGDVSFVLDRLSKLPDSHHLSGKLHLAEVGTIGHSRGNSPAFRAALEDDRIRACAGFDALGSQKERNGGLVKPFLNIRSDEDWSTRTPYLNALYSNVSADAFDVQFVGFGHNGCADADYLGSQGADRENSLLRVRLSSEILRKFFASVFDGQLKSFQSFAADHDVLKLETHRPHRD